MKTTFCLCLVALLSACGSKTDSANPIEGSPQRDPVLSSSITPELQQLFTMPVNRWADDLELEYVKGCMGEAQKVVSREIAIRYCACALIITQRMTSSVEDYLGHASTYNSMFRDIGAPAYCRQRANEM